MPFMLEKKRDYYYMAHENYKFLFQSSIVDVLMMMDQGVLKAADFFGMRHEVCKICYVSSITNANFA